MLQVVKQKIHTQEVVVSLKPVGRRMLVEPLSPALWPEQYRQQESMIVVPDPKSVEPAPFDFGRVSVVSGELNGRWQVGQVVMYHNISRPDLAGEVLLNEGDIVAVVEG